MEAALNVLFMLALVFFFAQGVYFCVMYCAWPPSVPTDRKTRRVMAMLLAERAPALVYDLGSGFGHLASDAARACPGAQVIAVEKFPVPFYLSKLRALFVRRPNLRFMRGDLFAQDYREADALLCFLLRGKMMERVAEEIWPQLKPGAALLTNGGELPGLTPARVERIGQVIGGRDVRVYVKATHRNS